MKKNQNQRKSNKPQEQKKVEPVKALLANGSKITITHLEKDHVYGTVDGQPISVYLPKEWVKKWFYN